MAKLYTITLNGVTEETYNQATDYIQKNALRLNYRPVASTIDVEFPDDIDPAKAPEGNQFLIDKHKARGVRDTKELMEFIGQPEYE